ncbi:Putative extracellular solute-binding protein [Corynebacterium glyciniphilum AJ 3170]|uniref:Putative extracellular solute-binding protein n=1 Tax=Corynebacterium glyciniphilum AJ 3170 TaxID=1404245 RepID=X5DV76_9CORY|nr:transporter substrate-binding domain-containing protein [Corynebacterium glyciniphilum]AHW65199.1 Putative extracellular solute-binding protein [Corynebacterium glyciniphilum AJ 3170]
MNTRTRIVTPVAAAVVATVSAMALASCVSNEQSLQQWPDAPNPTLALPNGSKLSDNVDDLTSQTTSDTMAGAREAYGSLRPDTDPRTGQEVSPARRVPAIVERGRLVVGVAQSLNQLGFRDPVTGELAGFEIDLAREIARDIFGDPNRIEYRYVEGNDLEDVLSVGTVDLVIRTFTITRPRQEQVEFSVPYLTTYPRILAMRDSGITGEDDLADKTVCVTHDSTNLQELRDEVPHQDILATQTWSDCLMAIQRRQADAIYSDSAILSGLQAQDPYTEIIGDSTDGTDYGVAAALPEDRDTAGLVRQVNSTMDRIRTDGTWDDIYDTWLEGYLGAASQPPAEYRSAADNRELTALRERSGDSGNTEREEEQ